MQWVWRGLGRLQTGRLRERGEWGGVGDGAVDVPLAHGREVGAGVRWGEVV